MATRRQAEADTDAEREAEYRAMFPPAAYTEDTGKPSAPEVPNGDAAQPANPFRARSPRAPPPADAEPADVAAIARQILNAR